VTSDLHPDVGPEDHARGPADAAYTLVVYGDYECPYSRTTQQAVDQLFAEGRGDVRYIFRHFPLNRIHPHAVQAAEAAEAAGAQGQFWAMHDLLFERQDRLELADLVSYAAELGLDELRFSADLRDGTFRAIVRGHTRGGVGSGVQATPTIFLNGVRRDDPDHVDALFSEIFPARRSS
jgi:protein-disulfide isomerase